MSNVNGVRRRRTYLLLLPPLILLLLLTLAGGLLRLGMGMPVPPSFAALHGPLLIGGFFSGVIALERAVALGQIWGYSAPLAHLVGAVLLLAGFPGAAAICWVAAYLVLLALYAAFLRMQAQDALRLQAAAVFFALVGVILWRHNGYIFPAAVTGGSGFLLWTITAERLELNRLLGLDRQRRRQLGAAFVLSLAALLTEPILPRLAPRIQGLALLAVGVWLLRYDLARRTIRMQGLTRYVAAGLLTGYFWLVTSGLLRLCFFIPPAGPLWDAVLHTMLVGFVLSMVFAHAPIIAPALSGRIVRFSALFYVPLTALHAGLLLRVVGDLAALPMLRVVGATTSAIAVLVFLPLLLSRTRPSTRHEH